MNEQSTNTNTPPKPHGKERSLEEAVSEVKRELGVRARCYSRWVDEGKLTSIDATDRYERMSAAHEFLKRQLESQQQGS